jgi:hypothetical protein
VDGKVYARVLSWVFPPFYWVLKKEKRKKKGGN